MWNDESLCKYDSMGHDDDDALVRAESLCVRLSRREVLSNVSFALHNRGQVVGLFGPNGAGKTTLMRTLAGLICDYRGSLTCPSRSEIAFLPDCPFLYPFLRLSQAVDLFACRYRDFDAALAKSLLTELGLALERRVGECSKGMLEQLHLSLTLARRTRLYVFDEPLAAVDPLTRERLVQMMLASRPARSTILISTHLISDVEDLFDETMMIADGRLLVHDGVGKLRSRYRADSMEDVFKIVIGGRE